MSFRALSYLRMASASVSSSSWIDAPFLKEEETLRKTSTREDDIAHCLFCSLNSLSAVAASLVTTAEGRGFSTLLPPYMDSALVLHCYEIAFSNYRLHLYSVLPRIPLGVGSLLVPALQYRHAVWQACPANALRSALSVFAGRSH